MAEKAWKKLCESNEDVEVAEEKKERVGGAGLKSISRPKMEQ